jgi:pimeloyl-ACP methyl ester carboxylesterase
VAFREGFVEADGFRIRFMEAGQGTPLVHLHGAGGMHLTPAHDLLSRRYRVIAFEMPGFGDGPENIRTETIGQLAGTMSAAVTALGVEKFNLMGTSFGGRVALWLAVQHPERLHALVLEAPAAIRLAATKPPWEIKPEEMVHWLYAHPERLGDRPVVNPTAQPKIRNLLQRLIRTAGDTDLEARMRELVTPTLVMFGTLDRMISPDLGRCYKELIPNCHLVFVYDAGHAITTDRPEAFADVTADFLERHEAFVINRTETVIHP